MDVKLNDEQLNKALEAAILVAIGETGREEIIKNAVAYLTREERSGAYGRSVSVLFRIVNEAAERIARVALEERLRSDPTFIAAVESLYADATKRMFDAAPRETLVQKLALTMAAALSSER